jgi:hypothetical protein
MLIRVVVVDPRENVGCPVYAKLLRERGEVEVVTGLVATYAQECLDPQVSSIVGTVTSPPDGTETVETSSAALRIICRTLGLDPVQVSEDHLSRRHPTP